MRLPGYKAVARRGRQEYLLAQIDESTSLAARHFRRGRTRLATSMRNAFQRANAELGDLLRGAS